MQYHFSTPMQSKANPSTAITTIELNSGHRQPTVELAQLLRSMIADKFGEAAQACAVTYDAKGAQVLFTVNPDNKRTYVAVRMQVSADLSVETLRQRLIAVGMTEGLLKSSN